MKLRISPAAAAYIRAERAYLARLDKRAAASMIQQMRRTMEMLLQFPDAGKALEMPAGARRFSTAPYVLDYDVTDGILEILIIRHARQLDPNMVCDVEDSFEDD
ncbi:type II toxin-antitoxin system RelE/ParE family toxin [Pararhizobium sp.]|uniref:type II toxin-antitoxin system RelE/ParE family toxin n=1 Tax=Pararhizobium sp. TaxID=1977563 RepID=UPI00271B1943|nr:type II toxin-antitoxin system RelE/ParE family toxin [Pararhizobium sp.]MDO9417982.1 type II toxin-antitoxin system RelE/ParE family toxin [Pararhizobium sp.]